MFQKLLPIIGSRRPLGLNPQAIIQNGLVADYHLDEGSGTNVIDYSGLGNNGTFNGSPLPTWVATGVNFAINTSNRIDIPVPIAQAVTTQVLMTCDSNTIGTPGLYCYLGSSNGSGMQRFFNNTQYPQGENSLPQAELWQSGSAYSGTYDMMTPLAPTLSSISRGPSGAFDFACINGDNPTYTQGSVPGTQGIGDVGNLSLGADIGTPLNCFSGIIHRAIIYNRQLSLAELQANFAAINIWAIGRKLPQFINPGSARTLLGVGDSITQGFDSDNGSGINYPACFFKLTVAGAARTYTGYNFGITGKPLADFSASGMITYGPNFVRRIRALNAAKNIVTLFGGTNDAFGGATPAATFAVLQSCVAQILAIDPSISIVLIPMISRSGIGDSPVGTFDIFKNAYNALIAGASWGARVAVLSTAACPHLYPDGSYANTTYFSTDKIHPIAAGHAELANGTASNGVISLVNFLDP